MRRNCSAAISSREAISIGFRSFLLGEKSAARLLMNSHFPLLRVPVLLEIGDQRRREVAISLLACVNRHVAPELIERLLRHADGTPVTRCTDDARVGEARDDAIERRI